MKKFKFLAIVLALVIGISSCKKEEKAVENNSIIVGTWILVKEVSKTYKNNVLLKEDVYEIPSIQAALALPIQSGLFLKNDGTGNYYERGGVFPITYTVQSNSILTIISDGGKYTDIHPIILLNNTDLVYLERGTIERGTANTNGERTDTEYSLKRQ